MGKQRRGQWGFVGLLVLVTVLLGISSYFSIRSSQSINEKLEILAKHPFVVSSSVYKAKNILAENQLRMNRLLLYNADVDYQIVRNEISQLRAALNAELTTVDTLYLGPLSTVAKLQSLSADLQDQEQAFLALRSKDLEEVKAFMDNEVSPAIEEINGLLDSMLAFIDGTVSRLSRESVQTARITMVTTILFFCMFVLLCYILKRTLEGRAKDNDYREFLFGVLSKHLDEVFMIYNLPLHKMEYVFSNSETLLGLPPQQLSLDKMALFAHVAEKTTPLMEQLQRNMIHVKSEQEYYFTNPITKQSFWILLSVFPVEQDGLITRYILSVQNLTSVKETQQVLRDALIVAQNSSKAKTEFLSRMSHEIRTPLNAIVGMTTIASSSLENKERVANCLQKVTLSSKHLLLLINDVLDMSKIESGKFLIQNESFNIADIIRNTVSMFHPQMAERNVDFVFEMPVFVHEVIIGDSLRLNQILMNILSNALKYTPAGGHVSLLVREVAEKSDKHIRVHIEIADTGIGMSKEFQADLFEPFMQEYRNNIERGGSTGMGLAITKNLVSLMNGHINVKSDINKGSTFIIELPFAITPDEQDKYKLHRGFEKIRVLVVDDDLMSCENTVLLLQRIGIDARWTTSSIEGLALVSSCHDAGQPFHAIFADWKMPAPDGLEFIRDVRKMMGDGVFCVIITAYAEHDLEAAALLAGANKLMHKPLSKSDVYNYMLSLIDKLDYPHRVTSSDAPSVPTDTSLAGKHFLVVEDIPINMEIITVFLTDYGATVQEAVNGLEACDRFTNAPPGTFDIILMDIQMPKMNGYEATRTIRGLARTDAQTIPIIAMTANAFSEDILQSQLAGMNAHISKPIDIEVLITTLLQHL